MKVTVEKNNRGDYTAELDLNSIYVSSMGSVYAYGDTEEKAKDNLLQNIESLIEDLQDVNFKIKLM